MQLFIVYCTLMLYVGRFEARVFSLSWRRDRIKYNTRRVIDQVSDAIGDVV